MAALTPYIEIMSQLSEAEVKADIAESEIELSKIDPRAAHLWERVSVSPEQWEQEQYSDKTPVWVIAILGKRCLYFNYVERGWGWGEFKNWGSVSSFHWQQDYIHHSVLQLLFAIDNGGQG
jgi:hypothetical protein